MKRIVHLMAAVAVVLVGTLTAFADPPAVKIPADIQPVDGYVTFVPDTAAKSVVYVALDDAFPFPADALKDGRRFLVAVGGLKPGATYRFVAVATLNDEQSKTPFAFTVPGKKVDPDPKPNDQKPDPKPPAKVKNVRVAVVTESGDKDPRKAEFLQDAALQAYWKERGWDGIWWIDPQAEDPTTPGKPPAKWEKYIRQAAELKLPKALFIVNRDDGEILYEGKPAETPAELLKLLKDKTGG